MVRLISVLFLCLLVSQFGLAFASRPAWADPIIEPPLPTTEETALAATYTMPFDFRPKDSFRLRFARMQYAAGVALLEKGDYATLDRTMNQIQHDYEDGKRSDINLLHLFRAFYNDDPTWIAKYDAWVAAYPKSYAAREARSIFLHTIAYKVRGSGYANQLQQSQIAIMQQYWDRSVADSQAAISLTAKPILSYYDILTVAKNVGARQICDQMLALADKDDPHNYIVRFKYMLTLETRWGGSLQQMHPLIARVRQLNDKKIPDHWRSAA